MKIKSSEDYIGELGVYFPTIEEKELSKMVKCLSLQISSYLKTFNRGFALRSVSTLLQDGKFSKFTVGRIFGERHLKNMRKAAIKRQAKRSADAANK